MHYLPLALTLIYEVEKSLNQGGLILTQTTVLRFLLAGCDTPVSQLQLQLSLSA